MLEIKIGTLLTCKLTREVFTVTEIERDAVDYGGATGIGYCELRDIPELFEVHNDGR